VIVETLEELAELGPEAYVEAPTATSALAAAEALAAMLGKPMISPPESLHEWLAQAHSCDRRAVDLALRAIDPSARTRSCATCGRKPGSMIGSPRCESSKGVSGHCSPDAPSRPTHEREHAL
jgi:hypothetical protein